MFFRWLLVKLSFFFKMGRFSCGNNNICSKITTLGEQLYWVWFIHDVGIGIFVFILTLFAAIILGKAIGRTVTWTGVGSVDKSFGILFGVFKGYVVAVSIFSILNWFYPYEKWGISTTDAFSFNIVKKGSDLLIDEFPNYKDIIETKEKIEKI